MNRYLAANGETVTGPLVASIAIQRCPSGDESSGRSRL